MKLMEIVKKASFVAAAAGAMTIGAQSAHAVAVDLELQLLMDVSGSVDAGDFALQRQGYSDAFRSATIQNAITSGAIGSIAVQYIQWSNGAQQTISVDWTLIDSAASADAFADAIDAAPRAFADLTAPGSAINFGLPLFGTETGGLVDNGYEGTRLVMDVSGDGAENDGSSTSAARNAALAAGVDTINGVIILGEAGLQTFYQNNVVGGTNAFLEIANDFTDFTNAIDRKILREVQGGNGVPEPVTATLGAMSLGALGAATRRRRKA